LARRLTRYDKARGKRAAEIREGLGLTQQGVVERLNKAAEDLGLPARYQYYTVSRMEQGSMSFEDARAWLTIAKPRRTWEWFVAGDRVEDLETADFTEHRRAGGRGR
jgi:transcriptional regulator with XRE-family HTH domain